MLFARFPPDAAMLAVGRFAAPFEPWADEVPTLAEDDTMSSDGGHCEPPQP
jgi:hypothetical protein